MQKFRSRKAPGHKSLIVKPTKEGLKTLLAHHGVELQPLALDQIWAYHQLIRANNDDGDLTRLRAFETMALRHYADCTIMNAFVDQWPDRMVDIGSGAGFPGIPLKIVNPDIHLTLCEPRPKRVDFLNMVIEKLGLKNIDVFGHKVTSNSLTFPVGGCISRAFEEFPTTLLRVNKSLKIGGRAYFMKGPALEQELEQNPIPSNYRLVQSSFYTIPNSTENRAFLELERIAE